MTLQEWMDEAEVDENELADELGIARSTVHRIRRFKLVPRSPIMIRIYELTDGQVTPNDVYGLFPRSRKSRRVA